MILFMFRENLVNNISYININEIRSGGFYLFLSRVFSIIKYTFIYINLN